jgi:single-strand DNA-binding protein
VAGSINSVVIVGNLTRDPELRATPSGTSVCSLRVAVNDRVKDPTSGEWGDKPNYFDVDVFGGQGERCAQYLARGRQVAIAGRLRWREWETQDGQKRQAVSIVADNVQFIGPREGAAPGGGEYAGGQRSYQSGGQQAARPAGASQAGPIDGPWPGDTAEPDDDIPF